MWRSHRDLALGCTAAILNLCRAEKMSRYLHRIFVPDPCAGYLYRIFVPDICIGYLYRIITFKTGFLCLLLPQVNALKEYYEENDGGGQQMLKYDLIYVISSFKSLSIKDCSDGGAMGRARCSYSLRHNLLDHGHLQVHLWIVDLQMIRTIVKELFTMFKMNHIALN